MIHLNIEDARSFLSVQPETLQKKINELHKVIHEKTGAGNDYLGWLELPKAYDKEEYARVLAAAKKIRKQSKVLVVIGIGGSYLGAKAGLEFLNEPFKKSRLEVVFAGHQMSSHYLANLVEYLQNKKFSINVISKSGTTTEPAIAFRVLKKLLEEQVGVEEAKERIYATTDKARGALYTVAKENGYETFVIPDDVGGRYSVLTPVGLLPLEAAGIRTREILKGAKDAYTRFSKTKLENNEAYLYAATRYLLYKENKMIEMLVGYEPNLLYLNEWWKQLFGESEGKDHKGLFVASAGFSTDLHSLGQYIQEGERHLFETVIKVDQVTRDILIPEETNDLDELNYLKGQPLSYVNAQALKGTMMAHKDGLVPNILLEIPNFSPYTFGYLVYFFEKACAMSAYLIDVNPFNQPGVEAYKKNMFALLGKKGYEHILK
ncbi:MAG: glucose-6-phosphate isomerase [Tenericutes bacterium HGW-Tenericutes-6]|nr:MAG: glucose-6-phosphate isomerase [Tenericutes bacterium HGW-Tenericutes-6]